MPPPSRRCASLADGVLASSPNERWRFPYYRPFRRICPADVEVMAEWGHVRRGYRLEEMDALFGRDHDARATFISPVTVIAHDLSFSNLPQRVRRVALAVIAPAMWLAALLHRPDRAGTETAAAWRSSTSD